MAEISEELRQKRREAGRKGGLARVAKGFSKSGKATEAINKRWAKRNDKTN